MSCDFPKKPPVPDTLSDSSMLMEAGLLNAFTKKACEE